MLEQTLRAFGHEVVLDALTGSNARIMQNLTALADILNECMDALEKALNNLEFRVNALEEKE